MPRPALRFLVVRPAAAAPRTETQATSHQSRCPLRVLVVDDTPDLCDDAMPVMDGLRALRGTRVSPNGTSGGKTSLESV